MSMLLARYHNSVTDQARNQAKRAPVFDPADHTVAEVNAYLAGADEAERARVLDAEQAGKDRQSVRSPEGPEGS